MQKDYVESLSGSQAGKLTYFRPAQQCLRGISSTATPSAIMAASGLEGNATEMIFRLSKSVHADCQCPAPLAQPTITKGT